MLKGFSDPAEARTQDPQIKSLLLYQLSYGVWYIFGLANKRKISLLRKQEA